MNTTHLSLLRMKSVSWKLSTCVVSSKCILDILLKMYHMIMHDEGFHEDKTVDYKKDKIIVYS